MNENNPMRLPRWILGHEADMSHNTLAICAIDEPTHGGANHHYDIMSQSGSVADVKFQKGPIIEHGVNGVTIEALLAICADRLHAFQTSEYACAENESALAHIESALDCLHVRTRARRLRGVEGTSQA